MWYGGHDGSISRILSAVQRPNGGWVRSGVSVDAGLAGPTDIDGVDAPSVVRLPTGLVMAYLGSEGTATRVHLATSGDGRGWRPAGPFRVPGERPVIGSGCLIAAEAHLWLFYASPGRKDHPSVFGATSSDGTTWHDVGPVLEPEATEHGVSEPWVVVRDGSLLMLFVVGVAEGASSIGLATSFDGRRWSRRPAPLDLARRHHDAGVISGPSALHLGGEHMRIWYAAESEGDTAGNCRLWSTELVGAMP